jgi:predicted nucleic acid-binding protein
MVPVERTPDVGRPAWYEFLCGPVASRHIQIVRGFLAGGVIAFEEVQAIEAARLFNAVGRARRLRTDAMIAATAIVAGARLATSNAEDFKAFVPHGLTIVQWNNPVPWHKDRVLPALPDLLNFLGIGQ